MIASLNPLKSHLKHLQQTQNTPPKTNDVAANNNSPNMFV